jgi:hypothetical protein
MATDYFEVKVRKSVSNIEDKVTDISNILHDIDMKLSHLVKDRRSYYDMIEGSDNYSYQ